MGFANKEAQKLYYKQRYTERRAAGLCVKCGEPSEDKATCDKCAEKNKASRDKSIRKRKSAGICQNAGCKQAAMPGRTVCSGCSERASTISKARYLANKTAGLCPYCGKEKSNDDYACEVCAAKQAGHKLNWYNDRKILGVCTQCNAAPATPGFIHCPPCRKMISARVLTAHYNARQATIDAYGGPVCQLCGEEEYRLLQIDHINGGGTKHLKEIGQGSLCRHLAKEGYPDGYRVLCCTCNKRAHAESSGKARHKLLLEVMTKYGGPVCVGCGEADLLILEMDHIDGGGTEHRKKIGRGKLYDWLKANNFPAGYRVLCPNCNHRARMSMPFPNQQDPSHGTP